MSNNAIGSYVAVLTHYWETCSLEDVRRITRRPELTSVEAEMMRRLHRRPPFGLHGIPEEVRERAERVLLLESR